MGITAKGAWVSVQRHFREMGVDVQKQPIRVAGVGDMSGDVFGNGMLLSKAIKLVAAFDHRHIFLDPDPDPAKSWKERKRMFGLPRSTWDDYDKALISKGGGVFPRSQKSIPLIARGARDARPRGGGDRAGRPDHARSCCAEVDLLWFGGIGTYIKARGESQAEVGDPGNDAIRVNAADLRVKAIGEGANLGITQAGADRVQPAWRPDQHRLHRQFGRRRLLGQRGQHQDPAEPARWPKAGSGFEERNLLLAEMTDDVGALVLEDNRLQTLALSIAERGGARALPQLVRVIEILEESGRLNRAVEGLDSNEELLRRAQANLGLTRPELAVLLSTSKMRLQAAIEAVEVHRRSDPGPRAVRRLPQGDAGAAWRRHPRPPPEEGDHRHQGRQPLRQPARHHRALLADRGGRRRRSARPPPPSSPPSGCSDMDDAVDRDRRRPTCPSRSASLCSTRPRPGFSCTSPICCAAPRRT